MGGDDGMSHVIIPRGDGCISHTNVDPEEMELPDDAEVYDDRETFEDRLSDFD